MEAIFVRDKIEIQNTHFIHFSYDSCSYWASIQIQMGANDACFTIKNLIMHWIMRSIKIHVLFSSFQTAFLCPPLLDDFFLVSRLIYTSTRERNGETIFLWSWHGFLAPIFGAFLCDLTEHCRMLIFISLRTTRTSRWTGFLITTNDARVGWMRNRLWWQ